MCDEPNEIGVLPKQIKKREVSMTTYDVVFVHGGWGGSWVWEPVRQRLVQTGIATAAVELPSCGAAAAEVDFRDDAVEVRRHLEEGSGPVVLVGHSYGGIVVSEATAINDRVRRLVYVAAFMPDEDEAVTDLVLEATEPDFSAGIVLQEDGRVGFPDVERVIACANPDAPADTQELVRRNQGDVMSVGTQPGVTLSAASWRAVPSTYIVCAHDGALNTDFQRRWARERATDSTELDSDHCPQLSQPETLARTIESIVRSLDDGE